MERQHEMPDATEGIMGRSKAKVTSFVVFTSALLIIVYKLLDTFIEKLFTTNKDEAYGYVMQAGILACTVSIIKFNTLFLIGKKLQIIDIDDSEDGTRRNSSTKQPMNRPSTSRSKRLNVQLDEFSEKSDDDDDTQDPTATSSIRRSASVSSGEESKIFMRTRSRKKLKLELQWPWMLE